MRVLIFITFMTIPFLSVFAIEKAHKIKCSSLMQKEALELLFEAKVKLSLYSNISAGINRHQCVPSDMRFPYGQIISHDKKERKKERINELLKNSIRSYFLIQYLDFVKHVAKYRPLVNQIPRIEKAVKYDKVDNIFQMDFLFERYRFLQKVLMDYFPEKYSPDCDSINCFEFPQMFGKNFTEPIENLILVGEMDRQMALERGVDTVLGPVENNQRRIYDAYPMLLSNNSYTRALGRQFRKDVTALNNLHLSPTEFQRELDRKMEQYFIEAQKSGLASELMMWHDDQIKSLDSMLASLCWKSNGSYNIDPYYDSKVFDLALNRANRDDQVLLNECKSDYLKKKELRKNVVDGLNKVAMISSLVTLGAYGASLKFAVGGLIKAASFATTASFMGATAISSLELKDAVINIMTQKQQLLAHIRDLKEMDEKTKEAWGEIGLFVMDGFISVSSACLLLKTMKQIKVSETTASITSKVKEQDFKLFTGVTREKFGAMLKDGDKRVLAVIKKLVRKYGKSEAQDIVRNQTFIEMAKIPKGPSRSLYVGRIKVIQKPMDLILDGKVSSNAGSFSRAIKEFSEYLKLRYKFRSWKP